MDLWCMINSAMLVAAVGFFLAQHIRTAYGILFFTQWSWFIYHSWLDPAAVVFDVVLIMLFFMGILFSGSKEEEPDVAMPITG